SDERERKRNRDSASAARNANASAKATAATVTMSDVARAGRNSMLPEGSVTTRTKLSNVNWSGKKCGVASRMAEFGRNAEFTIQYTGKTLATKTTTARTLNRMRTERRRGGFTRPPSAGACADSRPTDRA